MASTTNEHCRCDILLTMFALIKWVAIITSSLYDDILLSIYLTTRDLLCQHLNLFEHSIYHSSTLYAIGFLIGGLFWNVLSKCIQVKKMLSLCQIGLFISTLGFLYSSAPWQIFSIRFMQGIFASGAFIYINILVKHNFRQKEFNKFLALNTLFAYIAEAIVPLVSGILNSSYNFKASIVFLLIILAVSMYTIFLNLDSPPANETFVESIGTTSLSYWKIISSQLVLILIVVGMTEGIIDMLFNILEHMMENIMPNTSNQLLTLSISGISICSSISVNIISWFDSENNKVGKQSFNWSYVNRRDKMTMYYASIAVILGLCSSFIVQHNYWTLIAYIVLIMIGLCIIHYIGTKMVYSVYYSSGCIASSIGLAETLMSAIIQGISGFAMRISDNRFIFLYCILFFVIMLTIIRQFYKIIPDNYEKASISGS